MFNLFKKKTAPAEPVMQMPKTIMEYLWLKDDDYTEIGNKFYRAYREDLEDNDEYSQTKKEILDGYYYPGDKIYKFEPLSLPFRIEDNMVYSYIKENEWVKVGRIKKTDIKKLAKAIKTELFLMPNYYKKVYSDDVETDHGDSYFGLEVTLPIGENNS